MPAGFSHAAAHGAMVEKAKPRVFNCLFYIGGRYGPGPLLCGLMGNSAFYKRFNHQI